MLRFAADEGFRAAIVDGLRRLNPDIDIVTVQERGLRTAPDPVVLDWAANEERVLLTHDTKTMRRFAYERVQTPVQHAPMSIMVSLYPPPDSLRVFAAEQGRVTLKTNEGTAEYPRMQVLSVEEMLRHGERPKLPPVDPRSLVGDTQDKMLMF